MKRTVVLFLSVVCVMFAIFSCADNPQNPGPDAIGTATPTFTVSPTVTLTATVEYTIYSNAATDGIVYSSSTLNVDGVVAAFGDNGTNEAMQVLLNFIHPAGLPSTIAEAKLRVYINSVYTDVYTSLGTPAYMKHVTVDYTPLDGTDYAAPPLTGSGTYAAFKSDSATGWNELDITTWVQADITAGRTKTQIRLFFETATDNDSTWDVISTASGDDPANMPRLIVK